MSSFERGDSNRDLSVNGQYLPINRRTERCWVRYGIPDEREAYEHHTVLRLRNDTGWSEVFHNHNAQSDLLDAVSVQGLSDEEFDKQCILFLQKSRVISH